MFDAAKCHWHESLEEDFSRYTGMWLNRTDGSLIERPHGIVREIWPNGWIFEGTYKNGSWHGLNRIVEANKVIINLYKNGESLSQFEFNREF